MVVRLTVQQVKKAVSKLHAAKQITKYVINMAQTNAIQYKIYFKFPLQNQQPSPTTSPFLCRQRNSTPKNENDIETGNLPTKMPVNRIGCN